MRFKREPEITKYFRPNRPNAHCIFKRIRCCDTVYRPKLADELSERLVSIGRGHVSPNS
jgi:hypothetical protein